MMSHRVCMEENTAESAATVAADSLCGTQGWNTIGAEGGEGVSGKSASLKESNRVVLLVSRPSVCSRCPGKTTAVSSADVMNRC